MIRFSELSAEADAAEKSGAKKELVKALEAMLALGPQDFEVHLRFAAALLDQGDLKRARESARRALILSPSWDAEGRAHAIVSRIARKEGKTAESAPRGRLAFRLSSGAVGDREKAPPTTPARAAKPDDACLLCAFGLGGAPSDDLSVNARPFDDGMTICELPVRSEEALFRCLTRERERLDLPNQGELTWSIREDPLADDSLRLVEGQSEDTSVFGVIYRADKQWRWLGRLGAIARSDELDISSSFQIEGATPTKIGEDRVVEIRHSTTRFAHTVLGLGVWESHVERATFCVLPDDPLERPTCNATVDTDLTFGRTTGARLPKDETDPSLLAIRDAIQGRSRTLSAKTRAELSDDGRLSVRLQSGDSELTSKVQVGEQWLVKTNQPRGQR